MYNGLLNIYKEKDFTSHDVVASKHMHIAEVVTIAKSLPLLRLNTYNLPVCAPISAMARTKNGKM